MIAEQFAWKMYWSKNLRKRIHKPITRDKLVSIYQRAYRRAIRIGL